jgi:diacylglycerol kinase (ATP)
MKALLIQHKDAGGGSTSREALTRTMKRAGWKVRYLARKDADAKAIAAAKADLIVVAGGDGTVAKILAMLPNRTTPLAIIPTGTANDIAHSLGITGDAETIIEGWDIDRRQRLDVGNAQCPWGCQPFAEGVGFGAFADSLRRAPDIDGKAKLEAGRQAFQDAVNEAHALRLEVELDGRKLPRGLLLVEVMIVPLTGPRLPITPDAEPGDGRLHVSWLPARRRAAMREWLGRRQGDPPVEQASAQEVRARGGGAMMRIDDQCCWLEPKSKVTLRLEGEPVQILAPANGPALAG